MKSEEYRKGFIDGYRKANENRELIDKQVDKMMKPLRDNINKLRRLK
jgi:hypothetical protein